MYVPAHIANLLGSRHLKPRPKGGYLDNRQSACYTYIEALGVPGNGGKSVSFSYLGTGIRGKGR